MEESLQLTPRFTQAVDYARQVHVSLRKGTQVPYMAHLLGVASLVLGETGHVPFPVTEDMAIAALLHDAVEDEGGRIGLILTPPLHDPIDSLSRSPSMEGSSGGVCPVSVRQPSPSCSSH